MLAQSACESSLFVTNGSLVGMAGFMSGTHNLPTNSFQDIPVSNDDFVQHDPSAVGRYIQAFGPPIDSSAVMLNRSPLSDELFHVSDREQGRRRWGLKDWLNNWIRYPEFVQEQFECLRGDVRTLLQNNLNFLANSPQFEGEAVGAFTIMADSFLQSGSEPMVFSGLIFHAGLIPHLEYEVRLERLMILAGYFEQDDVFLKETAAWALIDALGYLDLSALQMLRGYVLADQTERLRKNEFVDRGDIRLRDLHSRIIARIKALEPSTHGNDTSNMPFKALMASLMDLTSVDTPKREYNERTALIKIELAEELADDDEPGGRMGSLNFYEEAMEVRVPEKRLPLAYNIEEFLFDEDEEVRGWACITLETAISSLLSSDDVEVLAKRYLQKLLSLREPEHLEGIESPRKNYSKLIREAVLTFDQEKLDNFITELEGALYSDSAEEVRVASELLEALSKRPS